jgi:hypothetical protein
MAKAKVATRKKGSKRRNANAKVKRKSAARRATAKKVELKVRRAGGVARKLPCGRGDENFVRYGS